MLRSLKDLENYRATATDGDIGKVVNLLVDDEQWVVRYLVVETGGFLAGRRVLISPSSFREIDWATRRFHLALTMDKVKNSPNIDTNKPVSRQHEWDHLSYYGYASYWGYSGVFGMGAYPNLMMGAKVGAPKDPPKDSPGDVHLRSVEELHGYHVHGSDNEIGHVEDFVVDDGTWAIRYLVIDTRNWWFGKHVLVAPQWATRVSYDERMVYLDMPREMIKNSPEWNANAAVNREYEERLYDYYGRPVYWAADGAGLASNRGANQPQL